MANSLTPTNENNQTATPPRTTKSNIKIVGMTETNKYMLNSSGMASEKLISAPKNNDVLVDHVITGVFGLDFKLWDDLA